MLALANGRLRRERNSSYSGGAKREHGEAQAERLVAPGRGRKGKDNVGSSSAAKFTTPDAPMLSCPLFLALLPGA